MFIDSFFSIYCSDQLEEQVLDIIQGQSRYFKQNAENVVDVSVFIFIVFRFDISPDKIVIAPCLRKILMLHISPFIFAG